MAVFPSSYPACQQNRIFINNNNKRGRRETESIVASWFQWLACPKSTPVTSRCVSLQAYTQRGWVGFSTAYCPTGTMTYTGLTVRLTKHNGSAHSTLRMDEQWVSKDKLSKVARCNQQLVALCQLRYCRCWEIKRIIKLIKMSVFSHKHTAQACWSSFRNKSSFTYIRMFWYFYNLYKI